ncbi:putative ABC transport system permease protein [Halanaerobium saccharolyticum]|uniref:Putative ABC transport system permease protein n=1 Tax=Halanaerobium saccharolyticum TaxID=43595 RepID=A0A4R7YRX7_9FIRM|nr:ABC transporter permease [Halanaerobium saccharolyticum]RAK10275.1 putative ABC transport system permease protein [Halanaerobium saccharolyticum]TDW00487.1 putative ABC transport system permease protein [Halanaerobium saccharolyticum]TDX52072.1 putative ABC transport system permease protein [Halanaerobium saccharolyticum]
MFFRMIRRLFSRGLKSKLLAILAITFGASLMTAMLSVTLDIGDKLNKELKSFGSNIVIVPESKSLPVKIDGVDFTPLEKNKKYIDEKDITNIKMIFWRHNIVDFAPYLTATAEINNKQVPIVGTWFKNNVKIPTGERFDFGVKKLKSWWEVEGDWITNGGSKDEALIGLKFAEKMNIKPGDQFEVTINNNGTLLSKKLTAKGILKTGDQAESKIYVPLDTLQSITGLENKVEEIEVSALTTPENKLARRAKADPDSLTTAEFDTWYCTAYVSSIIYQIEESIPGVVGKEVRQITQGEGQILNKMSLLMLLVTITALISSGLGISSIMTTRVLERQQEIGLLKAIGASNLAVIALFTVEISLVGLIGGLFGYGLGNIFATIIGQQVFGTAISVKLLVLPLTLVMAIIVALVGSSSPLRMALKLDPAEVLRG